MTANPSILVIAPNGMFGRGLVSELTSRGWAHQTARHHDADITDEAQVGRLMRASSPKVVFNCAAWTDVDGAETQEAAATAVNGLGVANLARHCRLHGALLVHYSTDYVFDGQASAPYSTDAPHNPVNAYGRSKAAGERAIFDSGCRFVLIRTSWLYAPWGNNFVRTIARASKQRPALRVVDDQRGRPTSVEHLARLSLSLVANGHQGVFHGTDGGDCTWFDFACEIAKFANPACVVEPCTSDAFPRPARRPSYSVLDISKTEAVLGPLPRWQDNLRDVLTRLEPL